MPVTTPLVDNMTVVHRRLLAVLVVLTVPLLAAGCVTTGPELRERTRATAARLAREDVEQAGRSWQAAVRPALDDRRSSSAARAAGRRAVVATPVAFLTVLDEATAPAGADEVTLPVTVVEQVDGGGGALAARETVRMCVLLVTPAAPGAASSIRDLACPDSLPDDVPVLGTVTAVVPWS